MAERPSLYAFAGGAPAMLALARAHHARCLADEVLNHPFSHGGHPDHIQRLARYWGEVLGGPPLYSQSTGGQPLMLGMHAGTDAESEMGSRFLDCFLAAIVDAQLPDDIDFRRALRSYMEWAVADVMSYAPKGSEVRPQVSVPRWSWNGLAAE